MTRIIKHFTKIRITIKNNKYHKDILTAIIICLCIYLLSIYFDFYEKLFYFTLKYEKYELDEIVILLVSIITALLYFSYKRFKDLNLLTKELESMYYLDQLTGLKNRHGFLSITKNHLKSASLQSKTVSLILIDLDRFKVINDTLGHTFGDIVLKHVSERLVNYMGKDDIVFRHGGDEFIISLNDLTKKEVEEVAQRILDKFTAPFVINNHKIFISPSLGISQYPKDGSNVETLIKSADLAMYFAKANGRNNYKFYNSTLSKINSKKMHIENGLRKALENNEFILHYQPQFNLTTGKVIGVEALIRWNHPKLGLVSPLEFISIAEETGLIVPIGKWVLETACKDTIFWHQSGFPNINVAVNISVQQFKHKDFIKTIKQVLAESKLDPKYLELEITESIMQNIEESSKILSELKTIGVKLSIDDFGTGYSSLSVLQHLPIDTLKIDKSFIDVLLDNLNTSAIVKTIIDMGSNLNLNVIAEGIENNQQAHYLKQNKCHLGQGFLFSKPLPPEEFLSILN